MIEKIADTLARVRREKPLIHQMTNYVSMNDCANITLAVGASPVMTQDAQEAEEMVAHARALVINLGTLESHNVAAMLAAGRRAKELSIPIVLDPVGVGATRYRTETAQRMLQELRPDIIRCNMSELKVLCGLNAPVKGVDSVADAEGGEAAARMLAGKTGGVIAVTGQTDIVTDGQCVVRIENGHTLLTRVTGTGCMTTALTACFAACNVPLIGAVAGVLCMGISGELAAETLRDREGPGMFKVRLMDAAYLLNHAIIELYAKVEIEGEWA